MAHFTLAILKPDLVRKPKARETVLSRIEQHNLKVVARKPVELWPRREVEGFYKTHAGKFFYERLINYMGSGPIEAVVIQGDEAVTKWRELIGPTHLAKARQEPNSLRALFAESDTKNSFHGSDSAENAREEILHFFPHFSFSSPSPLDFGQSGTTIDTANAKEGVDLNQPGPPSGSSTSDASLLARMASVGTALFHPFRVIGLYCGSTPVAVQKLGNVHFVAAPLDDTYQIYNADKLTLVQVGSPHPAPIKAIAVSNKITLTACGASVFVSIRGKKVGELNGHTKDVTQLLVLGDRLVSCGEDHQVRVWNFRRRILEDSIDLPESFSISALCHPDTYLNKIVLGSREGGLQLWNFRSHQLIFNFPNFGSAVTCIVQSPVTDIVAVGLENGKIVVLNLRSALTLFTFHQEEGAVTALSFRTDGHAVLASASRSGAIALWDLEKHSLITLMPNAHFGAVTTLQFFAGEPLLLSTGTDNSIKIWIFDQSNGNGRLLRHRTGHSQPPTRIRFFVTSSVLLSASRDKSFRLFSTVKDQRSHEFSQGKLEAAARKSINKTAQDLKLPPIHSFDASIAKSKEWDNVLTCHNGLAKAITWRKDHFAIGKHKLKASSTPARAVAISACGNFGLVGATDGTVNKFNMQSGLHRGAFVDPALGNVAHSASIEGIAVDASNRYLLTASLDGFLKFWNFKEATLITSVPLDAPATHLQLHRESNLVAVACDDLVLRVFDVETQMLVRRLKGPTSLVTDMTFSGDGRWLACAVGDGTVRVFDLPTSQCTDWFKVDSPVTSLTFSPRSDFLATTHVDSKGIYLWANKNYFTDLFVKPVTAKEPSRVLMPALAKLLTNEEDESSEESVEESEEPEETPASEMDQDDPWADPIPDGEGSVSPLGAELITLSTGAKSKWKSLVNLDIIRERNKPERPPEVPKSAPFILPTLPGLEPTFITTAAEAGIAPISSHLIDMSKLRPKTKFIAALEKANESGDTEPVVALLHSMTASAVDFELRAISKENEFQEFKLLLRFIQAQLQVGTNFEVVQSVLNVFLKLQGEHIPQNKEVVELLKEVLQQQRVAWQRLQGLIHLNLGLVSYFSNLQT